MARPDDHRSNVEQTMRAVRIPGPVAPAELTAVGTPVPRPGAGEALVRVHSAGVNRSDVLACQGLFPGPYPRTLGREYAGRVVAGPQEWVGRLVWGAGGGDYGITKDGTHAEYVSVPVDTLTEVPDRLDPVAAGGCALAYFTAVAALERTGPMSAGSWVAVSGAVGAVGHAAVAVGRWRGADVVSVVRDEQERALAEDRGDELVVVDGDELPARLRELTGGAGIDHAVDAVGGRMTDRLLTALAPGGAICVFSAPPEQSVDLDVLDFYRRDLTVRGLNTARLGAVDAAGVLAALRAGFESGSLTAVPLAEQHELSAGAAAYEHVARGGRGRPVLVPAST